jgi:hypothetical protein
MRMKMKSVKETSEEKQSIFVCLLNDIWYQTGLCRNELKFAIATLDTNSHVLVPRILQETSSRVVPPGWRVIRHHLRSRPRCGSERKFQAPVDYYNTYETIFFSRIIPFLFHTRLWKPSKHLGQKKKFRHLKSTGSAVVFKSYIFNKSLQKLLFVVQTSSRKNLIDVRGRDLHQIISERIACAKSVVKTRTNLFRESLRIKFFTRILSNDFFKDCTSKLIGFLLFEKCWRQGYTCKQ